MIKLCYLAGKYRAPTEYAIFQNIERARAAAVRMLQEGQWFPITPHLNSAFLGGVVPDATFLEGDLEIIRRCDAIYMLQGWEASEGARAEHALALSLKLPIIYEPSA